jgi:hypothetical protein
VVNFNILQFKIIGSIFVAIIASGVADNAGSANAIVKALMGMTMSPQFNLTAIQDEIV